jgi:hypothetical protein
MGRQGHRLTLVGRERVTEFGNRLDCREHTVLVVGKTSCDTIYYAHGLKRVERVESGKRRPSS